MNYEQMFEQALEEMAAGEYEAALTGWGQALDVLLEATEPNQSEMAMVCLNLSICQLQAGQVSEAAVSAQDVLEECEVELSTEIGQQLLGVLVETCIASEDYRKAREYSEQAWQALDEGPIECSPTTLATFAERRAVIARNLDQPDDAEEALELALGHFRSLLEPPAPESADTEPDPDDYEADPEILVLAAQLHEARAQNRYQGGAEELTALDVQDSIQLAEKAYGAEHPEVVRLRGLLEQLN